MTAMLRKVTRAVSGSITVEAAAALGFFLMICASLLGLFAVLNNQIKTEYKLSAAVEKCAAAGAVDTLGEDDEEPSDDLNFNVLGNGVTITDEDVFINVTYVEKLPFLIPGADRLVISKQVCRRAWTGRTLTEKEDSDSDDVYVYVTENGTVYHTDENCPNLKIKTTLVSREDALTMHNDDGGKYYPCEACGGAGDYVYITKYGDRFHMKYCPDINRKYRKVRLSEINLPLCSRCEYGKQKVNVKEQP